VAISEFDTVTVDQSPLRLREPSDASTICIEHDLDDDDSPDGIGHEHKAFLDLVFDALTDGVDGYTLGSPMSDLPFSDTAAFLVEEGFLEKTKLGNNELYYKPTKKAKALVDRDLSPAGGGEKGNESLTHRIGVRLLATYFEQQGYDVEMYHNPENRSALYDVYTKRTSESPDNTDKFAEVETSPGKRSHVEEDYQTLAAAPGDALHNRFAGVTTSTGQWPPYLSLGSMSSGVSPPQSSV